ncbi:hypothetical protein GCM10007860_21660 [Chitiniphilus shinanonensis]|uniref:Uncharacterized protein n=1 Tax=Chitiniphilus shinanonensis TaxID=553088 RepID=A0ABQ6BT96_9NEIS|nr:hypothetical protein [Chitiniphilus shinanonensis]GLS05016.1 hypothetical protein GCM10007860_21660 [Chitiniphilus shinanonensis]
MRPGILKTGLPLWAEITLILALKALLLWGAKQLWFSQPLTRTYQMTVPQDAIDQRLIGPGDPITPETKRPSDAPRV